MLIVHLLLALAQLLGIIIFLRLVKQAKTPFWAQNVTYVDSKYFYNYLLSFNSLLPGTQITLTDIYAFNDRLARFYLYEGNTGCIVRIDPESISKLEYLLNGPEKSIAAHLAHFLRENNVECVLIKKVIFL
jgi:hypothetical protein